MATHGSVADDRCALVSNGEIAARNVGVDALVRLICGDIQAAVVGARVLIVAIDGRR